MPTIPPGNQYRKHLINALSRRCAVCGKTERDIASGVASQWCQGPTGMWPVPAPPGSVVTSGGIGGVNAPVIWTPQGQPVPTPPPSSTEQSTAPSQKDTSSKPGTFNQQAHDDFMRGL
jgi:hypothetical protein